MSDVVGRDYRCEDCGILMTEINGRMRGMTCWKTYECPSCGRIDQVKMRPSVIRDFLKYHEYQGGFHIIKVETIKSPPCGPVG